MWCVALRQQSLLGASVNDEEIITLEEELRAFATDTPLVEVTIMSASDLLLGTEFECNRILSMDAESAAARIG